MSMQWSFDKDPPPTPPGEVDDPHDADSFRTRRKRWMVLLAVVACAMLAALLALGLTALDRQRRIREVEADVRRVAELEETAQAEGDRDLYRQLQTPARWREQRSKIDLPAWQTGEILPGLHPAGERGQVAAVTFDLSVPPGALVQTATVSVQCPVTDGLLSGVFAESRIYQRSRDGQWLHASPVMPDWKSLEEHDATWIHGSFFHADAETLVPVIELADAYLTKFCADVNCPDSFKHSLRLRFTGSVTGNVYRLITNEWELPAPVLTVIPADAASTSLMGRSLARWLVAIFWRKLGTRPNSGSFIEHSNIRNALLDQWRFFAGLSPRPRIDRSAAIGGFTFFELWESGADFNPELALSTDLPSDAQDLAAAAFVGYLVESEGQEVMKPLMDSLATARDPKSWLATAVGKRATMVLMGWGVRMAEMPTAEPTPLPRLDRLGPGIPPSAPLPDQRLPLAGHPPLVVGCPVERETILAIPGEFPRSLSDVCQDGHAYQAKWRPDGKALAVLCLARAPALQKLPTIFAFTGLFQLREKVIATLSVLNIATLYGRTVWQGPLSVRSLGLFYGTEVAGYMVNHSYPTILGSGLNWSADGRWLSWSNGEALWLVSAEAVAEPKGAIAPDLSAIQLTEYPLPDEFENFDQDAKVATDAGFLPLPQWSPRESVVAYEIPGPPTRVAVQGTGESAPRWTAPGRRPAWSPDGQTLVFVGPDGNGVGRMQLIAVDASTGRPIDEQRIDLASVWQGSERGTKAIVMRTPEPPPGFDAAHPTREPRTVLRAVLGRPFGGWSSDGEWVAVLMEGEAYADEDGREGGGGSTPGYHAKMYIAAWSPRKRKLVGAAWPGKAFSNVGVRLFESPSRWLSASHELAVNVYDPDHVTHIYDPHESSVVVLDADRGQIATRPLRRQDWPPAHLYGANRFSVSRFSMAPDGNWMAKMSLDRMSFSVFETAGERFVWSLPLRGCQTVEWAPR